MTNNSNAEHKFYFSLADPKFKEGHRIQTRDSKYQIYSGRSITTSVLLLTGQLLQTFIGVPDQFCVDCV